MSAGNRKKSMPSLVQLITVDCPKPSLQDNTGDIDRLKKNVMGKCGGSLVVPYGAMVRIAKSCRQADFAGFAVVNDCNSHFELVDFLATKPAILPAVALDLGTTHLEASLLDLFTGDVVAQATIANGQIEYGTDILSRIHFAATAGGLQILQQAVVAGINTLFQQLSQQVGISPADIRALAVSGNTTMVHFLLQADPATLCREPYIPLVNSPDICHGAELGLAMHGWAPVWIMPSVGSYLGGDLISGILASGLDERPGTAMLIDVGTNAEVVLGNRDWLIACAGAAGPALEGGIARMGMRAGPGAIDKVRIEPATGGLSYETLGGGKPKGLCGSGIIDLVAGLYLARMIDVRGRLQKRYAGARFIESPDGSAFVVVPAEEGAHGQPVIFSQVDLDAMMRSKAAMYSILTTLMAQVGLDFRELEQIFVAGSFGKHIDPRQAITLGMLPDLPLEVFKPIGNSSLAGAEMVLRHRELRARSQALPAKLTYQELNVNQEFMIRFSGCRFIPHTDPSLFPSVPVFAE
ncbi:MAG: ASKHA domain-containing protein [Deltaproteobacteria bacterium]|nr:ASKHA domain-containing protein [Deltaproteobacteria bacterium]